MVTTINFALIIYIFQIFLTKESHAGLWSKTTGKIKSLEGTKRGAVILDMTDGESLRLRVYHDSKRYPCEDNVVLEFGPDIQRRPGHEVDPVTVACSDLSRAHKTISTGFLSLGNSIYFKVQDREVMALFMINSKCIFKRFTDKNGNILKKVKREEFGKADCKKIKNDWQPNQSSLDKFEYDARLVISPKSSSTTDKPQATETPSQAAAPSEGTTKSDEATQTEADRPITDEFPTPPEESPETWPEIEDGFMKLISQDGGIPPEYKPSPGEHIQLYQAGHLHMVMQNYFGPMDRKNEESACVRRLSLFYSRLSLGEVTVSCGPVQGLTMTPVFLKYRRAFVLDASLPFVFNAMFNPREGPALDSCVQRSYHLEGTNFPDGFKVRTEEQRVHKDSSELCKQLMEGDVRGRMTHSLYDDSRHGLLENVFVSNAPAVDFDKSAPEIEIKIDQGTGADASTGLVGSTSSATGLGGDKPAPPKKGLLGLGFLGL